MPFRTFKSMGHIPRLFLRIDGIASELKAPKSSHHHKNGKESGVGDSDKVLQMILSSVAFLIVFPMVACDE